MQEAEIESGKCKTGGRKSKADQAGSTRVAFKTKSELEVMDDGFKWRKYGKKMVKNSPNPRAEEVGDLFLFDSKVIVEDYRLTIPAEIAKEYFPTLSFSGEEKTLDIDLYGKLWSVPFTYDGITYRFVSKKDEWEQISDFYQLNKPVPDGFLGDISVDPYWIQVYKPAHTAHCLIQFERRTDFQEDTPLFKDENFLFELQLEDIWISQLKVPSEQVHTHFKLILIPVGNSKRVAVKFTDAKRKNWYMGFKRLNKEEYVIINRWEEFAKDGGLEAGDSIAFYKSDSPSHRKHFLIAIVKRGRQGPNSKGF